MNETTKRIGKELNTLADLAEDCSLPCLTRKEIADKIRRLAELLTDETDDE